MVLRQQVMNTTTNIPTNPSDPAAWWRILCWVTPTIAVSGDLDTSSPERARTQLADWVAQGVTHIIDLRGEWSDQSLVEREAPGITYIWLGTHDNGSSQSDAWFEAGVAAALAALADPDAKVVVHCHMGVNRGPSMAFAILLALGMDAIEALEAIRLARPIAATLYAGDAIDWWQRQIGSPDTVRHAERRRVRSWLAENDNDVAWIISRIRRAG